MINTIKETLRANDTLISLLVIITLVNTLPLIILKFSVLACLYLMVVAYWFFMCRFIHMSLTHVYQYAAQITR